MTTGGSGIPRLQELSYLEVAACAVLDEVPFDGIRRLLVDHMVAISEASSGTGNVASLRNAQANPKRYVRNTSEALKELMKLGLLEKAVLPSSAAAAHLYRRTQFALTPAGRTWAELCRSDRRRAYDELLRMLLATHPQLLGFIGLVAEGFTVPLARWSEQPEPRGRERFVRFLAARVAAGLAESDCGWHAGEAEVAHAVADYIDRIEQRAVGKGVDAFKRNQDFVNACEEAVVKFAFTKAGTPIDYISHEILRRWTKFLGLANFSYYGPDPPAGLRIWPTADVTYDAGGGVGVTRRTGAEWRDRTLSLLPEAYEQIRREDPTRSLWVPIYRVRAAICSRLRIQDDEFDSALLELGRSERGSTLTYRLNLDPAQYGSVPPSERPLIAETRAGRRTYYSISLVPTRPVSEDDQPETERSPI